MRREHGKKVSMGKANAKMKRAQSREKERRVLIENGSMSKPRHDSRLTKSAVYSIQGIIFEVNTVFNDKGAQTLGEALVQLMVDKARNP